MKPTVSLTSLTFSDETTIELARDDAVVIVGPNNSGKSATLRGVRDKLIEPSKQSPVLRTVIFEHHGSAEGLEEWLEEHGRRLDHWSEQSKAYAALGVAVNVTQYTARVMNKRGLGDAARFFIRFLSADDRIKSADPAKSISLTKDALVHPIHFLHRNDGLELKLSQQFRRAFGMDLIVHRNAGNKVPLLVGDRPQPKPGQDRLSYDYIVELEKLPEIQTQGDGLRSFAGVLLHTSVGQEDVLLIDEPEAFLHPPQARLLGRMLVEDKPANRQILLATHSGDVLRGVLDANSPNVRVLRIRRSGDVNIIRQLDNERLAALWNDPLLRYSSILDGLFHEKVVIGESDSDCRFYAAVMDAICEVAGPDSRRPDVMFTHCGGKARLPMVIRALRELDVPLACVTDFDVLNSERPLRDIVESAGGDWGSISSDWKQVKSAIEDKKPELSTSEVRADLEKILTGINEQAFPAEAKKQIQEVLRRASPWSTAKGVGKAYIPSGQPTQAYNRLAAALHQLGIFVVEVGELEGFERSVPGHGPRWVNEVLGRDLQSDPDLRTARDFVSRIIVT